MAINFVRGFRRIGWVLTIPLAAFVVLLFYGQTTDIFKYDRKQVDRDAYAWEKVVEIPKIRGKAYFPLETKEADIAQIVAEIEREWVASPPPDRFTPDPYEITPEKRVNKVKMFGLGIGSLAIAAFVIQGSISILAWIFRGFRG